MDFNTAYRFSLFTEFFNKMFGHLFDGHFECFEVCFDEFTTFQSEERITWNHADEAMGGCISNFLERRQDKILETIKQK